MSHENKIWKQRGLVPKLNFCSYVFVDDKKCV